MSSPDEDARPHVSADNKGPGSQYVSDGSKDQNVATGSGVLYRIDQLININVPDTVAKGMPSLSQLLIGPQNRPQGPSRQDMIDWLMRQPDQTPLDSERHHLELLRRVAQGTGKWILDDEKFLGWKDASSPSRFLWMHGMLGSGKTMLVSLIVDSIQREIRGRNDVACVYFYFQEGEKHRVSLARIWATLLTQLLVQDSGDLAGELKAKFNDSLQGSTRLDSSEYLDLFKVQAATVKTVYLVIDALDSCQNAPGEKTQQGVQDALKALPDGIRVLFTSRNDWVDPEVGTYQKLSITPRMQDVKTYVNQRIEDDKALRSLLERAQDQKVVTSEVTTMTLTSGMFLLARLHMDNLSKQGTLSDIKTALSQLPDSAFQVFETSAQQIAQKIKLEGNSFESRLAKHILTWVIHAKTELNAEQILDSFAVQKSKGQPYREHRPVKGSLMRACIGLVILDPEKETLSLVHKSVQTHLQKYDIIPENAELEMAKTCLSYLLVDPCCQGGEAPLLRYAAKYWWAHLSHEGQDVDSEAESLTLKFLKDSPKLARAFEAMDGTNGGVFDHMTGLHAAVHFDLPSWAERLLESGVDVDIQCADGQTALHWAVRYGRRELLELLIRKSANPNIHDHAGDTPLHKALIGPTADDTPLHQAIMRSEAADASVVEALVRGNARLDIPSTRGLSPLSSAIRYGPTSIAKIMVQSQDDVDAEIFEDWTSLRQVFYCGQDIVHQLENGAAGRGSQRASTEGWAQLRHAVGNHARLLTDLLLERGVDLNRPSAVDGWTPLVHATKTGDLSKLRRLLAREPDPADVHLRDPEGKSPLWWAVWYKNADVIRLLAEHGADVNETYADGSTPLLGAVRQQHSATAQLLVKLGADANARTESASTLLIEGVKLRDRDTVWVLLNAGARPDELDASGWSALLYAIENRDKALVWLLIAKGASAVSPNKSSAKHVQSALELAMAHDDFSIAWLLCEHGASPTAADDKGDTPLHWAAKSGGLKAAHFLVDRGAAVDPKDAAGLTPLHYAVLYDWDDLVALLASHAARSPQESLIDIPDANGNTALALATLKKRATAMQTLLQHGASCDVADSGGLTALHHAADLGFNEGLRLLLGGNGDPSAADAERFTPLHHAVNGGCADPDTVSMLAEAGANLEAQDNVGRTPLMLAAQLGSERLVHTLLDEGADAQARNNDGWSAVDYAREYPNIQGLLGWWSSLGGRSFAPEYYA
ncbi:hypothetical protein DL769_001968 [Monosporascus sp. CRB-8-3]|nr:hypothetical protein DL769_001968 [Monosporascus sp. CRB-8-3]